MPGLPSRTPKKGFVSQFLEKLLGKPGPKQREIWFVNNADLGISDRGTAKHPALVMKTNGPTIEVLRGTTDDSRYPTDVVTIKPSDVDLRAGERGLSGETFFSLIRRRIWPNLPVPFVSVAGTLRAKRFDEVRALSDAAMAGGSGTTA